MRRLALRAGPGAADGEDLGGSQSGPEGGGVLPWAVFVERLEAAGGAPAGTLRTALLLLDLNRFQWINDAFGAAVGDRILDSVGRTLVSVAGPTASVGRIGGDRFGILVPVRSDREAVGLGRRLLASIGTAARFGQERITLTGRVGITSRVGGPECASRALRYAAAALQEARGLPTGDAVKHEPSNRRSVDRRARIVRDLHGALGRAQLRVLYQPVVALGTGDVVGYEALLRWRTADGMDVAPAEFIPIAEEMGLIEDIGRWVLGQASGVASQLASLSAAPLRMSVNLSARQFGDPALIGLVAAVLAEHGIDPTLLAVEITETLAVQDPNASATLKALRNLGCHVGLDDFGTGQSCLSYLRSLPVDFLKIDRSFTMELTTDRRAARLIRTITAMATDLGLTTVAEGIETPTQCQQLLESGCRLGQGFLFGFPLAVEALMGGLGR